MTHTILRFLLGSLYGIARAALALVGGAVMLMLAGALIMFLAYAVFGSFALQ